MLTVKVKITNHVYLGKLAGECVATSHEGLKTFARSAFCCHPIRIACKLISILL